LAGGGRHKTGGWVSVGGGGSSHPQPCGEEGLCPGGLGRGARGPGGGVFRGGGPPPGFGGIHGGGGGSRGGRGGGRRKRWTGLWGGGGGTTPAGSHLGVRGTRAGGNTNSGWPLGSGGEKGGGVSGSDGGPGAPEEGVPGAGKAVGTAFGGAGVKNGGGAVGRGTPGGQVNGGSAGGTWDRPNRGGGNNPVEGQGGLGGEFLTLGVGGKRRSAGGNRWGGGNGGEGKWGTQKKKPWCGFGVYGAFPLVGKFTPNGDGRGILRAGRVGRKPRGGWSGGGGEPGSSAGPQGCRPKQG